MIARLFGGPGESINLVPMRGSINQGDFGAMETRIQKLLDDGNRVQADIRLHYPEQGLTRRPGRIEVKLTITDRSGNVDIDTRLFDNRRPE